MELLTLFEITVEDPDGDRRLVVVAASEREARQLAQARGRVVSVQTSPGPLAVRGGSRIVGAVDASACA